MYKLVTVIYVSLSRDRRPEQGGYTCTECVGLSGVSC